MAGLHNNAPQKPKNFTTLKYFPGDFGYFLPVFGRFRPISTGILVLCKPHYVNYSSSSPGNIAASAINSALDLVSNVFGVTTTSC